MYLIHSSLQECLVYKVQWWRTDNLRRTASQRRRLPHTTTGSVLSGLVLSRLALFHVGSMFSHRLYINMCFKVSLHFSARKFWTSCCQVCNTAEDIEEPICYTYSKQTLRMNLKSFRWKDKLSRGNDIVCCSWTTLFLEVFVLLLLTLRCFIIT